MDPLTILALASKAVGIIQSVWDNRDVAIKAVDAIKSIVTKDPASVTSEDMAKVEAILDALLDEFNEPIPEG